MGELENLRKPSEANISFENEIAARMAKTVGQFPIDFITPMAAVAGTVADYILAALCQGRELKRASVNNGGDIAFYLNEGAAYKTAICGCSQHDVLAHIDINSNAPIRGIATSGWDGRSHSLGIADSVTVLAKSASMADAAATLIANAVDLPNNDKIKREPARNLSPDSDLEEKLVTTAVGSLNSNDIDLALNKGESYAAKLIDEGLVKCAFITLQNEFRTVGETQTLPDLEYNRPQKEQHYA